MASATPVIMGAWGALCVWTLGYVLLCAVVVTRHLRRAKPVLPWPAVPAHALVLRACAGQEPHLQDTLMSGVALRADAPRTLVHLVEAGDAAAPTASGVAQMLQTLGVAAKMQLTKPKGINHKACQMAVYDEAASAYGVSVCIDCDVMLMPDTLAALCAPLQDPKCGAAWLPFVQSGDNLTTGDRINGAILATSLQAFGVLRYLDEGHLVGKLVAIRPEALTQVGGWQQVTGVLGEDVALSQRLTAAGWQVRCGEALGYTPASGRTIGAVLQRYTRWAMVMRRQRPIVFWTYPLVVCPTPMLIVGWGIAAASMPAAVVGYRAAMGVAAVLMARLGLSLVGCRVTHTRFRIGTQLLDAWLADGMLLIACSAASVRRSVVWRRHRWRYSGCGRGARVDISAAP